MARRSVLVVALLGLLAVVSGLLTSAQAAPTPPVTSELVMQMPATAKDRTSVTIDVSWHVDDVGVSGPATLQFLRRGALVWSTVGTIEVVDGVGRALIKPRDDGVYRVSSAGGGGFLPAVSAPTTFDNVPTEAIRLVIGQYNLPGEDKLPRPVTRARKAAASIKAADLDAVTLNELVGPGKDSASNTPSSFARTVLKVLGPTWRMVTPTMTYNENYIVYRPDRLTVVQQYPDQVVPAVRRSSGSVVKGSARHVTPVLFKDVASNQPVLVGATHLINGNRAGARTQAFSVGASLTALSSGYPVVVGGDMNTSDDLEGLTSQGLKDARRTASKRSNPLYATFVTYSSRKPLTGLSKVIDQIYVPRTWKVARWVTVLPVKGGRFTVPRASDHLLVWSSLTGPRP